MASGAHLSRELFDLVKSIGESRSKQEEDRIIAAEKTSLKTKISEPGLAPKKMKELLIRAIYCEMLGHSADFAHIHAVNFTHQRTLLNKRIGYLASSLFLDCNNSLIVLMVATIQADLQSQNDLVISSALTALIRIVDVSIIQAVIEPVQKLLSHNNEGVRKKAVYAIQRFYVLEPSYIGDEVMYAKMKKALCDRDPSVMVATLPYFKREVNKNPSKFKDLISSFVVILKQVVEHKLPKQFEYHRMPAPWIQIKILQILALLGKDDRQSSENMYEVVSMVLRRADSLSNNIGHAVVYQCVKTLVTIYPSQLLLDTSDLNISRFISSDSKNLRYIGIDALTLIVRINPKYTLQYQDVVVDCLEDQDDTLKNKTLDLLYRMTNKQNVDFIIDKMLTFLRTAPTESKVRQGLVNKVCNLAEVYSKNKAAYIRTMNRVFETAADLMNKELLGKVIKLVAQWRKEASDATKFTDYTVQTYMKILESNEVLPDSLLQLIAWVVGEFVTADSAKATKSILLLCQVMKRPVLKQETLGWVLHALAKLHHSLGFRAPSGPGDTALVELEKVFRSYSKSRSLELQQRSLEYAAMKKMYQRSRRDLPSLRDSIFLSNEAGGGEKTPKPKESSERERRPTINLLMSDDFEVDIPNKELDVDVMDDAIDSELGFLDMYVQRAIDNGAAEYKRGESGYGERGADGEGSQLMAGISKMKGSSLKVAPYEGPRRPKVPPPGGFNSYINQPSDSTPGEGGVSAGGGMSSVSGMGSDFGGGGVGQSLRPMGTGLANKWTTQGYMGDKKKENRPAESPGYMNSDLNRMSDFEKRPGGAGAGGPSSSSSGPGSRLAAAESSESSSKKATTAANLFKGVTTKEEEEEDEYEMMDEPKKPEPVEPAPSLLDMEAGAEKPAPGGAPGAPGGADGGLLSMEAPFDPLADQPPPAIAPAAGGIQDLGFSGQPAGGAPLGGGMGGGAGVGGLLGMQPAAAPAPAMQAGGGLFGDLTSMAGGGSLLGAPSEPTNLLMTDSQPAAPTGFSFTSPSASAPSGPPSMSAANFQPYPLTTEQFGAKWVQPLKEKKSTLMSMKIRTPQEFLQACQAMNFRPIEIIGKESIAASLYKGVHECLLHGTTEPNSTISVQLRSQSDEALQVASFLLNQKLA